MASRQSVSSILKPPKVRAPLKEIEPVDQDADENTATSIKRKVSFSGLNKIKMYNTCATSLTVNQAPMFDEKISISSDSLNGDKTKLSGKFEKSDGQITFESTDCTNVEDNGRVIIEYESPSDNMEMTEAKVGKLHDSIFLIDNYDSEHINDSLDNSENNMEFTEAKVGKIFSIDMEPDLTCSEMSETFYSDGEKQLCDQPSTLLPDVLSKSIFNKSSLSSSMEITCTNTKSKYVDLSNMETTCMTSKSQKSAFFNDDYKSFSMELTQIPDRQTSEAISELIYESSIESETSYESKNNSNCEFEIEQNILYTKTSEINNLFDHETIVCTLKNSDNSEDTDELLLSTVSMDIDPTLEFNDYNNKVVVSELVVNDQNSSLVIPMEVEHIRHSENNLLDDSIVTDPTRSSFVQEMSPEKNIDNILVSVPIEQSLKAHSSMFDQSQCLVKNKSIVFKENMQKNYSRKTMIHTAPFVEISQEKSAVNHNLFMANEENQQQKSLIVPTSDFNQSQSYENEDLTDKSTIDEENKQNTYSRKSIAPTHKVNEMQSFYENEDMIDIPLIVEDKLQQMCSEKSIASTSVINEDQFYENEDLSNKSVIGEENDQKNYSRKSITTLPVFDQSQTYENNDLSNMTAVAEENQLYSRKSITSTSDFNQSQSYENEDLTDKSTINEENKQKTYSRKSIAPTRMANEMQSFYENEDILDIPPIVEDKQQQIYPGKSIAPTSVFNQNQFYENEDLSNKSVIGEENDQKNYSRKSISTPPVFDQSQSHENKDLSDIAAVVEDNQQKMYSRKSIVPISVFNESAIDTSEKLVESEQKRGSIQLVSHIPDHNQSCSPKNDFVSNTSVTVEENVQKRYSRKTIGPNCIFNETPEDSMTDNSLLTVESDVSSNIDVKQSDICNHYNEKLSKKSEHQSALVGVINDDDLNSPFRKKSRKSITLSNLIYKPVQHTLTPLNDNENLLETTDDNPSEQVEYDSKMDISIEYESKNDNVANISSQVSNIPESISLEAEEHHVNIENHDGVYGKNNEIVVVESNETNLNELAENIETFKEDNRKSINKINSESTEMNNDVRKTNCAVNSKDDSISDDIDTVTNTICVEGISNMSITDDTYVCIEKSFIGNRKRSYSNRECAPLSCSSVSKSNVENSINKEFNKEEELLKENPIKIDDVKEKSFNDSLMGNMTEEDLIEENENLSIEVLEFLTRWTELFVEQNVSLNKCTNREWIFNVLHSNILLTILFSPISNDHLFLKVEDISFTSKIISQNEIMKFGINWILSKYNPKVYKQICFTSRDVELLLKSLLEDVHFINEVMNTMVYVRDVYCVTFKDNKAQFVLHNMHCPLMVRIEILLSNIHKLSVKDITIDCFFGFFNAKLLDEILENVNKDSNILQSLVEKLRKHYTQVIVP